MLDTSVSLAGLHFRNPLLPGSGPPGDSLEKLQKLDKAGIGGLVTKTISLEHPHVPRPCMAFDGDLFFNVEKWSTKSPDEWTSAILPALKSRGVPLIVSVGYTPADLEQLIPQMDGWADAFEISTHYLTSSASQWLDMVKLAKELTVRPVFMKLSVHAGDVVANAVLCEKGGADGVTAINSIGPVMSIDVEKRASRLGDESPYMWLSGHAIKPVALRAVYDIARSVSIPVIGCGGVATGTDMIEFMLAGATAVQCCTALARKGPDLVPPILDEVAAWCRRHNVSALREIIGSVTPHYVTPESRP